MSHGPLLFFTFFTIWWVYGYGSWYSIYQIKLGINRLECTQSYYVEIFVTASNDVIRFKTSAYLYIWNRPDYC